MIKTGIGAALALILLLSCGPPAAGPAVPAESPAQKAAALNQKAVQAVEKGDFGKAIEHIDKALTLTPEDTELMVFKGMSLSRIGRFQDAVTAYNEPYQFESFAHPSSSEARKETQSCLLFDRKLQNWSSSSTDVLYIPSFSRFTGRVP